MFIICVIDLLTKNENVKYFSVISFQKSLIFHMCSFSENAQCLVGLQVK